MADGEEELPGGGDAVLAAVFTGATAEARRHLAAVLEAESAPLGRRVRAAADAMAAPSGAARRGPGAAPEGTGITADVEEAQLGAVVAFVASVLRLDCAVTLSTVRELAAAVPWPAPGALSTSRLVGLLVATRSVLGAVADDTCRHQGDHGARTGEGAAAADVRRAVEIAVEVVWLAFATAADRSRPVTDGSPVDPDRPPALPELHDVTTGLAGRALLADRLRQVARRSQRRSATSQPALLFIGLSVLPGAATVVGDQPWTGLVPLLARRLGGALRPEDTVGRLSPSELAVLCEQAPDRAWVLRLASRVLQVLSAPIVHRGEVTVVGTCIGAAIGDRPGWDPDALLATADHALYRAGGLGPGHIVAAWLEEPIAWP